MNDPCFSASSDDLEQSSFIHYRRPGNALPFDGERFTTAISGRLEHEHLHRYLFARRFCRDRIVLDVASGEGYGAAMLAQVARQVLGVDLSQETVAHAQKTYASSNLSFARGDCLSLPVSSNSIDVFVSFETLEHIDEHEKFFREVKRVLKPNGTVILSTPDRRVYSEETGYKNPFHIRELAHQEFDEVVRRYFAHARFLGQRAGAGSFLLPVAPGLRETEVFSRFGEEIVEHKALHKPRFIIAVASDYPLSTLPSSIFYDTNATMNINADDEVRQALARVGESGGSPLREVYSMTKSLPKAGPKTRLERIQGELLVTADDDDPRLELPLTESASRWLLVRAELIAEEECTTQVYFRSSSEAQINPVLALFRVLKPGPNRLHLLLSANELIDFVRFDPTDRPGRIVIRDLVVLAPDREFGKT